MANPHKGSMVVPGSELVVDNDLHSILAFQIEEVFFFVAYDHGNVADAGGAKLFDLSFDKDFPTDSQKALWLFIRDGNETTRKARSEDDGIVDLVRVEFPATNQLLRRYRADWNLVVCEDG